MHDEVLLLTPLVHQIAHALRRRLPQHGCSVEESDLRQAGWLGVLDAAQRYTGDALRAVAPLRIKGAMIDELRRATLLCSSHARVSRTPVALGEPPEVTCDDSLVRLADDELTPEEELVLILYATHNGEGRAARAVERQIGKRIWPTLTSAREKLERLAA